MAGRGAQLPAGTQTEGQLTDWNQVAFLFRSVKNPKVRALAAYLEQHGIPVYSPRANQFFDREEVRLMIGALIFLFPQFQEARKWQAHVHLDIWDYLHHQHCFAAFAGIAPSSPHFAGDLDGIVNIC